MEEYPNVSYILLIIAGVIIGVVSGVVGLGGGFLVVPFLRYVWGFNQHQAQGTTLGMLLPPIGILGAYVYWRAGYIDIPVALLLAFGFIFGAYIGGIVANLPFMNAVVLQRIFGVFFLVVSLKMLLGK